MHRKSWAEPLPLPPADTDLARLYEVWTVQRGTAATPARTQIRPEELGFMLGRINLVDVHDTPPRFTFRIMGTQIGRYRELEPSEQSTALIKPLQYRELVEAHYAEAHAAQRALLHQVTLSNGTIARKYRRIILPYATEGHAAGLLLTGTFFPESTREVVQSPAFLRDD